MQSKLHGIHLDTLLAEMPTPLVVLDTRSQTTLYANHAAQRLRFAFEDAPGWQAFDAEGAPLAAESWPHRDAMRGATCHRRLVHFRKDAQSHALLFHCHALEQGLVVLTFDDLTSFEEAQHQLREALQARDELVSMAAHELRSPLGALQLIAERLARKAADMAPDELRRIAETAMRQTTRLNILVSNLLDVSRMRAGKFELELETASLGDIVREASEPLVEQARSTGTTLTLDIRDRADGRWDRVRMEQVLVNLVTNAIKYGSGTPIEIELARAGDDEVVLQVRDGGMGIAVEDRARIFEPFARAARSHAAQSLGLGLFIVRGIARAHGGDVTLDASPGKTVFSVRVPIR